MGEIRVASEIRVAPCERWVRAWKDGKQVLDTRRAVYVYGTKPYAVYFVPRADLQGEAPTLDHPDLVDHVSFDFDAYDVVLEEEQQVYHHPHDPLHRIDALPSRRRVEVRVDDEVVAASNRPVALYETTLPTRWYLPWANVRADLLVPSDTTTTCAYKGFARYWSLQGKSRLRKDLVWSYPAPFAGAEAIAGMLCFWSERVDLRVV